MNNGARTAMVVIAGLTLAAAAGCSKPDESTGNPTQIRTMAEQITTQTAVKTPVEQTTTLEAAKTPEQVLLAVQPAVAFLNECLQDKFGAQWNTTPSYQAAFTSQEAFESRTEGILNPAVLFLPTERSQYAEQYYLDPTECFYFPVTNYRTKEDVKDAMRSYMSEEMVERFYGDEFAEYEGKLYITRGARGYSAASLKPDSLQYLEQKAGIDYVSVDVLLFDKPDYTATLGFEWDGAGFKLVSEEH